MNHRPIAETQKDIADTKRELRSLLRAAGDDLGCDGTGEQAGALRAWLASYQTELTEARIERAKRRAIAGQIRRLS